jgi:signal transduction histidine kinase
VRTACRGGRPPALHERASALEADLLTGRRRLTHSEWSFYVDDVRAWLGPREGELPVDVRDARARSNAIEHAWRSLDGTVGGTASGARADQWREAGRTFVVLSSRGPTRAAMLVLDAGALIQQSTASLSSGANAVVIGLAELDGTPVVAVPRRVGATVSRLPAETGLPWTLTAAAMGPLPAARAPRTLLWSGLGALALLLTAGTFFIGRAITRELEVARMQSEFVSAVSHEFRTPLASVCHISEMLVDGRVADPGRRSLLYATLHRESERLRRLVEGLLDFARMDARRQGVPARGGRHVGVLVRDRSRVRG